MHIPDVEKAAFRTTARNRRLAIENERRNSASALACMHIKSATWWSNRRAIGLYAAYGSEIDPYDLEIAAREANIKVFYPRVHKDQIEFVQARRQDLVPGFAGILEPRGPTTPIDELDLIIVPGLAFDTAGQRLGSGRGFYDRLLSKTSPSLGIAYEEQIVAQVPTGSHDRKMAGVVTDEGFVIHPDFN